MAPTRRQFGSNVGAGTSIVVALPSGSPLKGNTIVLTVITSAGVSVVAASTNIGGQAFTLERSRVQSTIRTTLLSLQNFTASGAVVSVVLAGSSSFTAAIAAEYNGMVGTGLLDQTVDGGASFSGGSVSVGPTGATNQIDEVFIAPVGAQGSGLSFPGGTGEGYTLITSRLVSSVGLAMYEKFVTSVQGGGTDINLTVGGSVTQWSGIIGTYEAPQSKFSLTDVSIAALTTALLTDPSPAPPGGFPRDTPFTVRIGPGFGGTTGIDIDTVEIDLKVFADPGDPTNVTALHRIYENGVFSYPASAVSFLRPFAQDSRFVEAVLSPFGVWTALPLTESIGPTIQFSSAAEDIDGQVYAPNLVGGTAAMALRQDKDQRGPTPIQFATGSTTTPGPIDTFLKTAGMNMHINPVLLTAGMDMQITT